MTIFFPDGSVGYYPRPQIFGLDTSSRVQYKGVQLLEKETTPCRTSQTKSGS